MRIYIDEAGSFVVPPTTRPHSFSLVLALAVPSASEADLFYEFLRLRDDWPNPAVEIKGSTLDESEAAQVIDLVCRYEVLVNFFTIDMATHGDQVVDDFRMRQAAAVTAHLTQAHHPNIVAQLHTQADKIRAMRNQLFLQAFLTIQLILEVIEEATLYYVQRLPRELGEIAWFVDRKNRTITQMEEMWTTLILPMSESHFARNPLKTLIGADYSHFDARYGFTAETVDPQMARHLEWMQQVHGTRPLGGGKTALNAKLLLSDWREFLDSRDSLGVQLADMLATILRRALNDRLQFPGWENFGKLLARKGQPGSSFLQLGLADGAPRTLEGVAKNVCLALDARAKSMLIGDDSR
ncbi:MAG TPA: DUF3800 domain-containing protein [Terriglobia bacterium]